MEQQKTPKQNQKQQKTINAKSEKKENSKKA